jgi:hypothetical protein
VRLPDVLRAVVRPAVDGEDVRRACAGTHARVLQPEEGTRDVGLLSRRRVGRVREEDDVHDRARRRAGWVSICVRAGAGDRRRT